MRPQDNELNLLNQKNHELHIAGFGFTSMSHYRWMHKFILMPQAMKIPDIKSRSK